MNSENKLVRKAVELAKENPGAFILYWCENYIQLKDNAFNTQVNIDGVWRAKSQTIHLENGSCILFKSGNYGDLAGYYFTHIIYDSTNYKPYEWFKSKVRSTKKYKDMGIYDRYGKYVLED